MNERRNISRQASDERGYNRMIMTIGYTHFLSENYPAAISNLQDALERFKSSDDDDAEDDVIQCDEYIGQVYLATGQYDLGAEIVAADSGVLGAQKTSTTMRCT